MARAAASGHARPRPCSAHVLAVAALAMCCSSHGVSAAAVSSADGASTATVVFSSPASRAFGPDDVVKVTYTSPFAWPVLSTWCDPMGPRQESIQKARPFSGQLAVSLSRIQLQDTAGEEDEEEKKECWFNLGSLADPDQPGTNSERFTVARRRGRRKGDDGDESQLELRHVDGDGDVRPTRTIFPRNQLKRAAPNIPLPTAQQTSGPDSAVITCPNDNRTVYTEPVTAKRYVILCGRDYSSDFGALDIRSLPSGNTNECIARCATDKTGCTAVGWGDYRGEFTCFMKKSIGDPNFAPQWRVAVEDPTQPGTGAAPQPQLAGGGTGLSGNAKAGIGVGAALGGILIAAGAVTIWYFEQRRQLRQRVRDVEERKLEAASSSTDGGGTSLSSPVHSGARLAPPTRESSYRSERQQPGPTAAAAALPPPVPPAGAAATAAATAEGSNNEATAGQRNLEPAGSIRSNASGPKTAAAPGSEGGEGAAEDASPGLAHVSTYLRQQQQFILDSCRQQQQTGPASVASGSDVTPTTAAATAAAVTPWSPAASELPVREGYQGYGPEYEMPSSSPRPHRAPGQPPWGAEAAEQKFLLADMADMKKVRVLRPEDRGELE